MRVHTPLLGLLLRPGVLWDVFVLTVVAILLPHLIGAVPLFLSGELEAARSFEVSVVTTQFCWAFLSAWALSAIVNAAWQDLTHCPISWLLPGLRLRLRRDLFVIAFLAAAFVALASELALLELGVFVSVSLALLGFALGNHLWDPHSSRFASYAAQVSTFALVGFAEPVVAYLQARPEMALIALVLCALSILQTTSRSTVRRRTLVPGHELGAAFESYGQNPVVGATPRPAARPRAAWRWGRVHVIEQWVNALRYEEHGYGRWELILRHGLLLGLTQLACFVGGIVEVALPMSAMLIVLFHHQDLRRGVLYPISRNRRARIVWTAAREQAAYFLGISLAVHPLLLLAESSLTGIAIGWERMSLFAGTALLVAAGLPFLQLVRLHLLEFHEGPVTTLRFGTTLLISSVVFCVGTLWCDNQLREINAGIHFVLVLGTLAVSLFAFRQHLSHWYQIADLT